MKGDKGMAERRDGDESASDVATYENQLEELLEKAEPAGGASEQMIASAEIELGICFPPSYRRFLSRYGAVVGTGFEINGLFVQSSEDEPPFWSCVLDSTKRLRAGCGDDLPVTHLPVTNDGTDFTYFLDLSNISRIGECPVVVLGPGRENLRLADTFAEFAVRLASDALQY